MKSKIPYFLFLNALICLGFTTIVTRVIDGDTFEIEIGEKVRLIGINAPELTDIFGQESKQFLTNLIEGKTIELQQDRASNERDRYSRLLGYVILDGKDINKQMISEGYAFAYLKYKFTKSDEYKQAQIEASLNSNGIWGNENNTEMTSKIQNNKNFSPHKVPKELIIISCVIILMIIGFFYYFKR